MAFHLEDDNYEIIKPIGKGGMSTVYLAKDKNLDRLVAIKLLHPSMSSDEKNRERLKIEALAIARINHENIVNVYNFVNKGDNSYIVMEYIDGETLSGFIERNPITSPELLLSIFLKILNGIDFSHQKNIIHRDIKPENIMVSENGKIKIMDFGIASIIGEVHNLTTTGSIMGSPMFMSPEHLTDEKIDKQSDLFSLGIILYWMLTKTYPFNGKNTAQLLNNILKCQYQNPQRLTPLISNDIKVIIKKILQKSKKERYQNSQDLVLDIENYFKNIDFDYKEEIQTYFNDKIGYHKHFIKTIPKKYLYYAKKLYKEKSYSKAISYSHLTLEYDVENSEAKDIIKKIERGNVLKKYIPVVLIASIIISLISYNIFAYKKKKITKQPIKKITSFNKSQKEINKKTPDNIYNYKKIYDEYHKFSILALKYVKNLKKENSLVLMDKTKDLTIRNKDLKIVNNKKLSLKIKKIIKKKDIFLPIRISPKAASVYINNKLYGYGNINEIKLKTNTKYSLKVKSTGCYTKASTLLYKDKNIKPITIRLNWKPAKLKILNSQEGDIFINNNYKGNYKEYNYEVKPSPLSNGSKKLNLKIIKDKKIILKNNVILKAGKTVIRKI